MLKSFACQKRFYWVFTAAYILWGGMIPNTAPACTLWAAAGAKVKSGGTLIAKNRDWQPNHRQVLKAAKRAGDPYRYYGLFREGDENDVKAGINEHGLVAVSASSPFPAKQRRKMPRTSNLNRKILANCRDVKDALNHASWLMGPRFLLLADSRRIALIEIALQGRISVQVTENGALYHSNHYLDPQFQEFNTLRKSTSSLARLERISRFMAGRQDYELRDFMAISASTDGGPNDAIWRMGKSPTSTQTLAAWIVRLPSSGDPQLYLKLANPGEEIREYHLSAATLFRP